MGLLAARRRSLREQVLLALAGMYVAVLAAGALLRAVAGIPHVEDLASTPAAVAQGRVWTLITSAFLVSGPAIPEIAGLAAVGALLVRRHGAGALWRAAAVGHVGSALVAYAGVGALALAGAHLAHHVLHAPDYGLSCVWAGVVGALGVSAAARLRRRPNRSAAVALAATYGVLVVLTLVVGTPLVRAEHLLALLLGGAVMLRTSELRPAVH
jgi:hypothetical protein